MGKAHISILRSKNIDKTARNFRAVFVSFAINSNLVHLLKNFLCYRNNKKRKEHLNMLDDVLQIATDVLMHVAERHATRKRTKRILYIIAMILIAASIICYFVLDKS